MLLANAPRQQIISSILVASFVLCGGSTSASTLDGKSRRNEKPNVNQFKNKKVAAPLTNLLPATPPGPTNMLPVATPPVTSTVTNFFGPWVNTDIVEADYPNVVESRATVRETSLYAGKMPDTIGNDRPIKPDDLKDFLEDYHDYLRDEGLESGSYPASLINESLPVLNRVKTTSPRPLSKKG